MKCPPVADAGQLRDWMADADARLDTVKGVTVDQLRALMAQPDHPRAPGRRTWYLEEYERLARAQTDAPTEWRAAQMEQLLDQHAEALLDAAASVAPVAKRRESARHAEAVETVIEGFARGLPDVIA